jgi:DNA modification methylase
LIDCLEGLVNNHDSGQSGKRIAHKFQQKEPHNEDMSASPSHPNIILEHPPKKAAPGRSSRLVVVTKRAKQTRAPAINRLNNLTAKEWIPETVSVWIQRGLGKGHEHAQIERQHPAPFSFQDVARLIRFFSKAGETVLDPFVGVGSTLKAAAMEGRRGIGIELSRKYADLARLRLKTELSEEFPFRNEQKILRGDAGMVIPRLPPNSVKLVVTSPPYWNILHKEDHKAKQERIAHGLDTRYSRDDADLGNVESYAEFLKKLSDILALTRTCLADGGHLCLVVGDFRQKSQYLMFHADIAHEMQVRGFTLKGLVILYQRHKRVFPYGFPYSYVPNLHHQYIVVLAK